jgi:hypothetical protein
MMNDEPRMIVGLALHTTVDGAHDKGENKNCLGKPQHGARRSSQRAVANGRGYGRTCGPVRRTRMRLTEGQGPHV